MGVFDKAKDKAEQLIGEAKERLGKATDDKGMESSGKRDKVTGEAKETGHDLRDKAAHAVENAKEKLRSKRDKG